LPFISSLLYSYIIAKATPQSHSHYTNDHHVGKQGAAAESTPKTKVGPQLVIGPTGRSAIIAAMFISCDAKTSTKGTLAVEQT